MRKKLVLAILAALVLATVRVPAHAAPSGLAWGDCPFDPGTSGAKCATLPVPLDYRDPRGEHIDIHLARVSSARPDLRRGTLVMNQGGPGRHLPDVASFDKLVPRSVLDAYDIVSFDQRGFGESAPVRCQLRPDQQLTFAWPLPGGEPAVRARAEGIAQQCAEHGGPTLPFLGAANVARDVDRIRHALGEQRISFLGVSYGAYLGVAYDTMFPGRVDRLLLDSNVDPKKAWRDTMRDSMTNGVYTRFPDVAAYLAKHHPDFGSTQQEVEHTLLDIISQLDRIPLSTPNGTLTGTLLRIAVFAGEYADAALPLVGQIFTAARDRDPAAAEIGAELEIWFEDDNDASAEMAVFCADNAWPRDPARYAREGKAEAAKFPLSGGAGAAIWPCAFWPYQPIDKPIAANPYGRKNILLINNFRDPATTYKAATALHRQLGNRSRLVGVDQGGHGAYLFNDNACAKRIGTDFLVHGTRPAADFTCPSAHAGLAGELTHLTATLDAPGVVAEVRDGAGTAVLSSGQPLRATDRVRVFSNTKTVTATVILQLVAEGRIGLDEPVESYLPGLLGDPRITVRHLLQLTSGLPDYEPAMFEPGGYYAHRLDQYTPAELVGMATAMPRLSEPGKEFHYATTNYVVAGMLVEKVTERPWASEVKDRIVAPLGLRHTSMPGSSPLVGGARGYAHLDENDQISTDGRRVDATLLNPSVVWAGGEIISTVSDLTTFFDALLGGRLLPPDLLAEMMKTTPAADLYPNASYGLGLIRVPLTCGGEYWTHGGSGLGYQTRQGYTLDGRRVSIATTLSPVTPEQHASLLTAVDTALCEATKTR